MNHTILLIQPTANIESRSWTDYETTADCLEGICKVFEEFLKKKNPGRQNISYDITELFDFIENLSDLSVLVFNKDSSHYAPHGKDFVKTHIFKLMKSRAPNS